MRVLPAQLAVELCLADNGVPRALGGEPLLDDLGDDAQRLVPRGDVLLEGLLEGREGQRDTDGRRRADRRHQDGTGHHVLGAEPAEPLIDTAAKVISVWFAGKFKYTYASLSPLGFSPKTFVI